VPGEERGRILLMAEKRREKLLAKLVSGREPVTGGELSQSLGVSRQVIVQDVALLRAKGVNILATPQGYLLMENITKKRRAVIACRHDRQNLYRELAIIVEHGASILDVIVEHPLYGELQGLLMIKSLKDAEEFAAKLHASEAKPLSDLTNGIHLHTIEVEDELMLDRIKAALQKEGILLT
jgi:transcriptional regulator of NAD metabolism